MKSLNFKNPVLNQLDAHKGTGRQATVRELPNIDQIVVDKSQIGKSTDPAPQWQETVPQGRQLYFSLGMVVVALVIFYGLLKYKVIKI